MASGIYKIENTRNGRCYIGSAVHLVNRWATHRRALRKGEHRNRYLQRAWDKYGEDAFGFEVLEAVADQAHLVAREQAHIDEWAAKGKLYNLAPNAGSNLGTKRTAATKAKMSASQKGIIPDDATRAAMSEAQKRSNEQNPELKAERVRRLQAGLALNLDKQRAATSISSANRVWTDESRAKLSASCRGRRHSATTVAKIAAVKCKPVVCTTASEAALACGMSVTAVSRVCLGRYKRAYGLEFIYRDQ